MLALCLLVPLGLQLSAFPATAAARTDAVDFAAIDTFVASEMRDNRMPGVALGIVHGDQVVHLRGFGQADTSGRAVTPQTPFVLGSITKSFTALAILQLVEAGKVRLDSPVQENIPWFRVADATASAQITVRNLLNQTSGLPNNPANEDQAVINGDSRQSLEQFVRALRTVPLDRPVGTLFEYTNTNYCVLGLIVQVVSGEPYATYIQQHIFAPLGMRNSYTSRQDAQQAGLARGYKWYFGFPVPYQDPDFQQFLPAGFLISTAADLSHYLVAQMNGGQYQGKAIASAASITTMQNGVAPVAQFGHGTRYGMGWFVGPVGGMPAFWHGGDEHSYHTFMLIEPQTHWGAILLINADSFLGDLVAFGRLQDGLARLLAGLQPPAAGLRVGTFYLLVDGVLLLLSVLALWSAIRVARSFRGNARSRHGVVRQLVPLVWELILPGLLILAVPAVVGYSWRRLGLGSPDVFYWLLGALALLVISGLARVVSLLLPSARRQEAAPAAAKVLDATPA
jgi:CubicO group peptidase (beta-lactamase class C family)